VCLSVFECVLRPALVYLTILPTLQWRSSELCSVVCSSSNSVRSVFDWQRTVSSTWFTWAKQ